MEVKIFSGSTRIVQQEINEWLLLRTIAIISMSQSSAMADNVIVTILFENPRT